MNEQQRRHESDRDRALEEAAILIEQRRFAMPPRVGDGPVTVLEVTAAIANAVRRLKLARK